MTDSYILSLKNMYNKYTRSLVDKDNITIKNLKNRLIIDLANLKTTYNLDPTAIYIPLETKNAIQTNINNNFYSSSFETILNNYKEDRKLLVQKNKNDIDVIKQVTKDKGKQLNDQILVKIKLYN